MFLLGCSESCVITLVLDSMVSLSLLASVFLVLKQLKNSWYGKVGQIYYRLHQSCLCLGRYCWSCHLQALSSAWEEGVV